MVADFVQTEKADHQVKISTDVIGCIKQAILFIELPFDKEGWMGRHHTLGHFGRLKTFTWEKTHHFVQIFIPYIDQISKERIGLLCDKSRNN